MLSLIISLALAGQGSPLKCPVMGGAVAKDTSYVEYQGASYGFCCAGCDANFAKAPDKFLATQKKAGNTVGQFLFDPVSHKRVDFTKAVGTKDFQGIRYSFESDATMTAFNADPAKFTASPAQEALYCPVGKEKIAAASKASGYVDHQNVRWYLCCAGCEEPFKKDPASFITAEAKKHVKKASARIMPKQVG